MWKEGLQVWWGTDSEGAVFLYSVGISSCKGTRVLNVVKYTDSRLHWLYLLPLPRVYHQARQSRSEGGAGEVTNPGEWPWAVLIFRGQTYVGAGVLLDNNLVATTATKVKLLFCSRSL